MRCVKGILWHRLSRKHFGIFMVVSRIIFSESQLDQIKIARNHMILLFISFIKSNQCNIMTVIKNKRRYLQGRTQKNFDPRILVQHAFSNTSIWASNQKLFRPLDKIPRLQKNSLSSYKFAFFSFFVVLFKSMRKTRSQ